MIRNDRVVSEQKSEIDRLSTERDEYKHCAEVSEKERDEYRKSTHIALRGIEIMKRNLIGYFVTEFPSILQQAVAKRVLSRESDGTYQAV